MKDATITALLQAYMHLEKAVEELYIAADTALLKDDLVDASLLYSQADKIYQKAQNLEILISEIEER